jgi:superfamily II DNA or RNA helicase
MLTPKLRPYQALYIQDIFQSWQSGQRDVLAVCATGGGKTVILSEVVRLILTTAWNGQVLVQVHRKELIGQISVALAKFGIVHHVIGGKKVAALHMRKLKRVFLSPAARVIVAGVDTLVNYPENDSLFQQTRYFITDEAHHVLRANKWGKVRERCINSFGLGVTATPCRADRKGLGRAADGFFDVLIERITQRQLIDSGYLTPYVIYAPKTDVDLTDVKIGESGEYVHSQLKDAVSKSHLVGDAVTHYNKYAPGKKGIVFAVDVDEARKITEAFVAAGIPACMVHAKTPEEDRDHILRRFEAGDLRILVNVDLFGEGFDIPSVDVVIMCRPTASFPLFGQQFGRPLRLNIDDSYYATYDDLTDAERRAIIAASRKPYAVIIDLVGNVLRHLPPDMPRVWSLMGTVRGKAPGEALEARPQRVCLSCTQPYDRYKSVCPHCGAITPPPAGRSTIEAVEGDLQAIDPAVWEAIYKKWQHHKETPNPPHNADAVVVRSVRARHHEKMQAHAELERLIQVYGAIYVQRGDSVTEAQRRFWHQFKVDWMSALTMSRAEMAELSEKIRNFIAQLGFSV